MLIIKKIICIVLTGMLFILSGCGVVKSPQPVSEASATVESETSATVPDTISDNSVEESKDSSTETSNILIVYFAVAENSEVEAISSASVRTINGEAKGHIRVLADEIQSNVGGDMFSILTSVQYPAGIMKVIDYADKEQKENARPELTSHIENLEDYDVIFVGYPNWWYDLPMVMYSFFEEYDFSGKTIVPFCTHNGSGFSGTINTIRKLEPNATVLDGFTTNFANVEDVSGDLAKWISGLDI